MNALAQRRRLIPKHRMNVRHLPLSISMWRRAGRDEDADRAQRIYDNSVRELKALGETITKEAGHG